MSRTISDTVETGPDVRKLVSYHSWILLGTVPMTVRHSVQILLDNCVIVIRCKAKDFVNNLLASRDMPGIRPAGRENLRYKNLHFALIFRPVPW